MLNIFMLYGTMYKELRLNLVSHRRYVYFRPMSHRGLSDSLSSSRVPATSRGMRLTRYAPVLMLCSCMRESPERLLRILPVSLIVSPGTWSRPGGAKSSAVKVPDLRSRCLYHVSQASRQRSDALRAGEHGEVIVRRLQWRKSTHTRRVRSLTST